MTQASELLADERARTSARIAGLTRQFDSLVESAAWTASDDEHDPEGPTIAFERAQIGSLLAEAREDLEALDRAAERVRDGSYGVCERCGNAVGAQRLAALPATRTCIRCAERTRR